MQEDSCDVLSSTTDHLQILTEEEKRSKEEAEIAS